MILKMSNIMSAYIIPDSEFILLKIIVVLLLFLVNL